jgi:hypothetical protein
MRQSLHRTQVGALSTVSTEARHAPMAVRLTSIRDRHHRSVVTRHVMRHRGFCRPVVDNAGHDAITGARRWRVRSHARRFCGVPPER